MRRTLSVAAVVAALLSSSQAEAWWCTGHMTVAEIAKQTMAKTSEGQAALSNVQQVISQFSSSGPFPKIPDLTQAGCWADDIKKGLDMLTADWHFLNMPYDPTNYPIAHPPGQKETVDVVLNQLDEALKEHPVFWEKSFALALMVHFYGDIHQPLHVTELFSSAYPNGDLGGNLIDVYVNQTVKMNLHATWDSICGYYTSDPNRPLDSNGEAQIQALAQNFMQMHTSDITPAQAGEWNTTKMAQEGYQDAIQYAYDNGNVVSSGAQLSSTYISNCFNVASRRIVLAGMRLASELTYVFKGDQSKVTAQDLHTRVHNAKLNVLRAAEGGHQNLRAKQSKKH